MSRGLLRCAVTKPKAALGAVEEPGLSPSPLPKYGWLKALMASARICRRRFSPIWKFFVSERLAIEYGWLRTLSSVVGTLRRPNELSAMSRGPFGLML